MAVRSKRGGESAYQSDGVALIRSMIVRGGKFLYDGLAHLDAEKVRGRDNVAVEPSDVLLNITGASAEFGCVWFRRLFCLRG